MRNYVLCLLVGLAACGGDDDGSSTPKGALVQVTTSSRVGVLLDEIPQASRERIANDLLGRPETFWRERATLQLRLTALRLTYRGLYYDEAEHKGALPLPPEEVLTITMMPAQRMTVGNHDMVVADFTVSGTLVTDEASPGISEPALGSVGGTYDEVFHLPVDPTLILERTGYACMDEDQFPPDSVEPANAYEFYDDQCDVETAETQSCHYAAFPAESCVAAVDRAIGGVDATIHYERIAFDETTAAAARFGEVTTPDSPDMKVITTGFQSLSNNYIIYRYFPEDHCAIDEQCVAGPGWRRLLTFDSKDHNVGGKALDIGPVDYANEGLGGELIEHNVYEYSQCHQHFHFHHYGDFTFSAPGTASTNKNGFCLESTGRASNNEHSTLYTTHTCEDQGVDPGWVDLYAAGLMCNWVDITDVDSSGGAVNGMLEFHSNPDGFMCEGDLVTDDQGNQVWEATSFTTVAGEPVDRPVCEQDPAAEGNDDGTVAVAVPPTGGQMSSPCATEQNIGPSRSCGFTQLPLLACTPGAQVSVSCTNSDATKPQIVRLCEASRALGTGVDCSALDQLGGDLLDDAVAHVVVFTCPAARDATETGGQFAVYSAPMYNGDAAATVSCSLL